MMTQYDGATSSSYAKWIKCVIIRITKYTRVYPFVQRHRWDSNPGAPVNYTGTLTN